MFKIFTLWLFLSSLINLNAAQFIEDLNNEPIEELLITAKNWLPKEIDLVVEGHPVFLKQFRARKRIFTSNDWKNVQFVTNVPKNSNNDIVVIVPKDQDGLSPLETKTRVVLIQSLKSKVMYTAHKAYIRTMFGGQLSVEWDFYEAQPELTYKNFFTAVTPTEYFQSKMGLSLVKPKNGEKVPLNIFQLLSTMQTSIQDVACFVAVFIPGWCKKEKHNFITPDSKSESTESDENISDEERQGLKTKLNYKSKESKENSLDVNEKSTSKENTSKKQQDEKESGEISSPKGKFSVVTKHKSTGSSSKSEENSEAELSKEKSREKIKKPRHKKMALQSDHIKEIDNSDGRKTENSSESLFTKFACPSGSGAILNGDRCYCPIPTVLLNRKCLNKTKSEDEKGNDDEVQMTHQPNNNSDKKPKKFPIADGAKEEEKKTNLRKRQVSGDQTDEEYDNDFAADLVEPLKEIPALGPFYDNVLGVHFNKEKAMEVMKKIPKKSFIFFRDRYKINNNEQSGHPEFESKKLPFTGIMDCNFEERKLKSFKGHLKEMLVDYFLHTLRAQCHRNLRKNTLSLFDRNITLLNKHIHNHIVGINVRAELMNLPIMSKIQWEDYISAIYFSKFSEAFGEEKINLDKRIQDNISPDRKTISWTVRTLTVFTEKVLNLLRQNQFQKHAVKITKSLVMMLSEYLQKTSKQDFIVDVFCKVCKLEHKVNKQDTIVLTLLSDYVLFGFASGLTFEEFYLNKKK